MERSILATLIGGLLGISTLGSLGFLWTSPASSTPPSPQNDWRLLDPVTYENISIFPVVSSSNLDTREFLTLDEGLSTGEVIVSEQGSDGMVRNRDGRAVIIPQYSTGASVNQLVLINRSKRPLLLLAGELVSGGKQDRIVGKDRIIAPESDPVDLSVFCVEHGRWTETSDKFGTIGHLMAQPSVRKQAMQEKDQQKVWTAVQEQNAGTTHSLRAMATPKPAVPYVGGGPVSRDVVPSSSETVEVTAEAPQIETAITQLSTTTSLAKVQANDVVQSQIQSITAPVDKSFESVIKQLRDQNAVGVVVAVKGRIIWADIFASKELLSKYWPKLLQSYAAEAFSAAGSQAEVNVKAAQEFVDNWNATHEVADSEPGLYRQTELTGDRFRAFELTSLLPKQFFDLHLSKMAE